MSNWRNPKYDLALKRDRVLKVGLILSLALITIAFKFFPDLKVEEIKPDDYQELFKGEEVIPTAQPKPPPPPPPPPKIVNEFEVIDDPLLPDIDFGATGLKDVPVGDPVLHTGFNDNGNDEAPPFVPYPQEMPSPVGGLQAIQSKIEYPIVAKKAGIEGKVIIQAFLNEKGIVERVELLKGISGGCDEEALAAVRSSIFNPGKQRGKAVRTQIVIPIVFKLR